MGKLSKLKDGDVIGFSGRGLVSDLINLGTYGVPRYGLSHIGIIANYLGRRFLFESTTLNGDSKCAIMDKPINGVQAHYLGDILERPGKVWHYELERNLHPTEKLGLKVSLLNKLGLPYDYAGAARSAGFLLRSIEGVFRREEISELFCSELVAYELEHLRLIPNGNASSQSPNSLARHICRIGLHKNPVRLK